MDYASRYEVVPLKAIVRAEVRSQNWVALYTPALGTLEPIAVII